MLKIKPQAGLKITDPKTGKFISEDGIEIAELSTYWERRRQCGDVTVEEVPGEPAKKNSKLESGGSKK